MISVQNLRLPLNGNKKPIIFIILLTSFASCNLIKGQQADINPEVPLKELSTVKTNTDEHKSIDFKKDNKIKDNDKITTTEKVQDTLSKIYPLEIKNTYKIAYLLPLQLEGVFSSEFKQSTTSKYSQDFYMGAKLALDDSISEMKLNLEVFIYDSYIKDDSTMPKILEDIKAKNIDLIIGPLRSSKMEIFYEYSKEAKIPMISPTAENKDFLADNPYFISGRPSFYTLSNKISQHIIENFKQYNLIILCENKELLETYKNIFLTSGSIHNFDSFHAMVLNTSNWGSATYLSLLKDTNNIIFAPIENAIVINSLLSYLIRNMEKDITLLAPYEWLNYPALETHMLAQIKSQLYAEPYLDFNDSLNFSFITNYRKKFNTEPNDYSWFGYQYTLMFTDLFSKYGKYIQRGFYAPEESAYLNFIKTGTNKAYENSDLHFYEVKEYEIRRLPDIKKEY